MANYTIYFDTETGGTEPTRPTIQLAAIVVDDAGREVSSFERKLKFDEAAAHPKALELNHYDREVWATSAVDPRIAWKDFSDWSGPYRSVRMVSERTGRPYLVARLAGHNAMTFDLPRLRELCGEAFFPFSYQVLDTLQRALWFFEEHPSANRPADFKLSTLCRLFDIDVTGAHDALTDVRLSAALARAIVTRELKVI